MGNAVSLFPEAGIPVKNADSPGASEPKAAEGLSDPFLAVLAQAVGEADIGEAEILAASAGFASPEAQEAGKEKGKGKDSVEEDRGALPRGLKSVSDLLTELRAELRKDALLGRAEGEDILSERPDRPLGFFTEAEPGADAEGVPAGALLSALRIFRAARENGVPAAPESEGKTGPDEEEPGGTEEGEFSALAASLFAGAMSPEGPLPEATRPEGTRSDKNVEKPEAGFLAASRVSPYLKNDLRSDLKNDASSVSDAPRTEKPEAESAGRPTEEQPSAFVPSISDREGRNFSDAGTPDPGREFGEKAADAKRDGTRGRAPAVGREAETGEKPTSEARATGFEQFFEGIRRDAGRTEPLNLASEKEAPLSRNEALREGVENVVRFVRASGEQRASLIVDPPALGRVSVELTNSSAGLEASIKVTSEQVRQVIQDQLAQLRLTLAQQGVQLTHFSVDVQRDGGHQRQEAGQERRRARRFAGWEADAEEERTFRVDLNEGLLYWVA